MGKPVCNLYSYFCELLGFFDYLGFESVIDSMQYLCFILKYLNLTPHLMSIYMVCLGQAGLKRLITALTDALAGCAVLPVCSLSYIQYTALCSGSEIGISHTKLPILSNTKLSLISWGRNPTSQPRPIKGSFVLILKIQTSCEWLSSPLPDLILFRV